MRSVDSEKVSGLYKSRFEKDALRLSKVYVGRQEWIFDWLRTEGSRTP